MKANILLPFVSVTSLPLTFYDQGHLQGTKLKSAHKVSTYVNFFNCQIRIDFPKFVHNGYENVLTLLWPLHTHI